MFWSLAQYPLLFQDLVIYFNGGGLTGVRLDPISGSEDLAHGGLGAVIGSGESEKGSDTGTRDSRDLGQSCRPR
ncbi:hypothetical protein J6590_097234 [Homalodisca vitripennis]|nr:hypothetical protein J6590_097234 [Homalodisca vitripennis]